MPPETIARFWSKVRQDNPDSCWPWPGEKSDGGYGRFTVRGRRYRASRLAWELAHGPIPKGLLVCHDCDNPPCCNPKHLFLGTHADNVQDRVEKGRSPSVTVTYQGQQIPLPEAAKLAGIPAATAHSRRHQGWPERLWFAPSGTRFRTAKPKKPPTPPPVSPYQAVLGMSLREAARQAGVALNTVKRRQRGGWPPERWFEPPGPIGRPKGSGRKRAETTC
jgi:hypothetical protein